MTNDLRKQLAYEAMAHLDVLYRTALRLSQNPHQAEDLVQETFLRAIRFYDRFVPGTNLRAWLLRILTNLYFSDCRKRQKEDVETSLVEEDNLPPIHSPLLLDLVTPEDNSIGADLCTKIQEAVEALPVEYRIVFWLADVEELSYREIAEVLECPIGTVMSRLHRARRHLQAQLVAEALDHGIAIAPKRSNGESQQIQTSTSEYRRRRKYRREEV
ncbi:MAG: sigma-70 family RNA polymerase sigma factor [Deltaproteobacteria bacterium]|nr:sigma-70 family RNA polymerase sigma factor [Deltaproteobacteria bacterium]